MLSTKFFYYKYKYIKKWYWVLTNPQDKDKKVSKGSFYKLSTILALIITIPGIIILFTLRHFEVGIIYQVIVSSVVFFICIGLSFKISHHLVKLGWVVNFLLPIYWTYCFQYQIDLIPFQQYEITNHQ